MSETNFSLDSGVHYSEGLSRRQLLAGIAGFTAVALLGACSSESGAPSTVGAQQGPAGGAGERLPQGDERQETMALAAQERREIAAMRPELPNPLLFKDGQALGAIEIHYRTDVARDWKDIDAYYHKSGHSRPHMNNPFVHRLVAGQSKVVIDPQTHQPQTVSVNSPNLLRNGVVLDKTSSSDIMVMKMHDVTPVTAAVDINGQQSKQSEMGINALVKPGDTLTWILPTASGESIRYTFVARKSYEIRVQDNGTAADKKHVQANIDAMFTTPGKGDNPVLRTYKCWKPGHEDYRLVDEWELVKSESAHDDVKFVGGLGKALADQ